MIEKYTKNKKYKRTKNSVYVFEKCNYTECCYIIISKETGNIYEFYENIISKTIFTSYLCNIPKDILKYDIITENEIKNSIIMYRILNKDIGKSIRCINSLPKKTKNFISEILNNNVKTI